MIELFSLGNIKEELTLLPKYFKSDDTLGGANNRHIPHLEKKFSERSRRVATSVNSCTNGIYLALRKLNLDQDPVLIPPIIFFGIGASVIKAGGIPVLSSVDANGIMCEKSVERALNSKFFGKKIPGCLTAPALFRSSATFNKRRRFSCPAARYRRGNGPSLLRRDQYLVHQPLRKGKWFKNRAVRYWRR